MGNLDYIFDNFNGQTLAMENLKAVMYTYGVEAGSIEDIEKKIDPGMHGIFSMNAHNKQILLTTNMSFSYPRDPLNNVRQGSKCFQQNLLAPSHFAGYIFDILIESGCLGEKRDSPSIFLCLQGEAHVFVFSIQLHILWHASRL